MMTELILLNVFLILVPIAAHAQAAPATRQMQCRSLAEAYYIVGPDEVLARLALQRYGNSTDRFGGRK